MTELGRPAPQFSLPSTSGDTVSLDDFADYEGLLVVFMCNHCPYVQAVRERLVHDARELAALGVCTVGISANDVQNYPEDSFENMQRVAQAWALPFPYLYDESQEVARAYGAVCTPDFFGYNADLELQYRGRLDASVKEAAPADARRELFEAMKLVAETGKGPEDQIASIGCSIKWKAA